MDGPIEKTDEAGSTTPASVLLIDDNDPVRQLVARELSQGNKYLVEAVGSAQAARQALEQRSFDVIITDLSMPEEDGISLMQWGKQRDPESAWIVLTGHGTLDSAVRALQLGAYDFLSKPLDLTLLANSVSNAVDRTQLMAERQRLLEELENSNHQLREHVQQLEKACQLLSDQSDTIQADLQRAGYIQQALLPQEAPVTPKLSIQAVYRPSQIVGGDLYDVVRVSERHVAVMIADAAGHGLSAAMLAVIFRHRVPILAPDGRHPSSPSAALASVNHSLLDGFRAPGLFITAAYCLVDLVDGSMQIASAGHPPLILQRDKGGFERIYHTGPALGLYPDAHYAETVVKLEENDRLFLHTDGLYDHIEDSGSSIAEMLEELLSREPAGTPATLQGFLRSDAPLLSVATDTPRSDRVANGLQADDVTLLMLERTDRASSLDNDSAPTLPPAAESLSHRKVEILIGTQPQRSFLSIAGRATWIQSATFHNECASLIDEGRDVLVDLTLCDRIDSTFLGTIHELSDRAERADVELRLQGVLPPVESLFLELGMNRVIDHVVTTTLPLPRQMTPLTPTQESEQGWAERVLLAHQRLSDLNDRNRAQFGPLLAQLRDEVAASQSNPKAG